MARTVTPVVRHGRPVGDQVHTSSSVCLGTSVALCGRGCLASGCADWRRPSGPACRCLGGRLMHHRGPRPRLSRLPLRVCRRLPAHRLRDAPGQVLRHWRREPQGHSVGEAAAACST
eukprot:11968716-Alexandrium_andersonii.AAC.1